MLIAGIQSLSFLSFFYLVTRTHGKVTITAEPHPGTIPILINNVTFYKPGQSLTLRCASDSPGAVLKWTRHNASPDSPPLVELPSGGGLDFKPIKPSDGGQYDCVDGTLPDNYNISVLHSNSITAKDKITNGTDYFVSLFCDQHFPIKFPVKWRKEGFDGDLNAMKKEDHTGYHVDTTHKHQPYKLVITNPDHYRLPSKVGRYTCELDIPGQEPPLSHTFLYASTPDVRFHVPPSTTLGETSKGDDYHLTCVFNGYDLESVKWIRVYNDSYNETLFDYNDTRIACLDAATTKTVCKSVDDQRIRLGRDEELEQHPDLKNQTEITSILVIKNISESDRAEYRCYARNKHGENYARQYIRVRDRMAALWPFLGILAELVFLGVVIFLCDRRRSKNLAEEEQAQPMLDQDATRNQDATREVSLRNRK